VLVVDVFNVNVVQLLIIAEEQVADDCFCGDMREGCDDETVPRSPKWHWVQTEGRAENDLSKMTSKFSFLSPSDRGTCYVLILHVLLGFVNDSVFTQIPECRRVITASELPPATGDSLTVVASESDGGVERSPVLRH